ncbi:MULTISPECIES: peroxiredoxin-like family protein [Mycobacterium]|uniref:Alkyl hydroperoxide reductase n=1 Tax=Mycobacterium syngnathidarum TaxID=1908205 RepID=A0A1Q9WAD1_9MYCO|nr:MULTISPECIES: peroxiredoxin-like family protein [Mycobacterium]MCG7610014.1 AhpC/TSA family protein [Mycobacterium sp. CnD-18-1]OHU06852.1 alkyl hydroperoxide reductase [Mycobacterium syngnathidarum]OLT95748.1 alkyl hydroperoxide reductase [Mycobacterium syngnathidarum]
MAPSTSNPPTTVGRNQFLSVTGEHIPVPDPDSLVHLQFRRFAGCPICNLHLQSFVARHAEIRAAGIREVVFFHSPAAELAEHTADLPFATIADPDRNVYRQFGVESSPRALLDPRSWPAIVRGGALTVRGRFRAPAARQAGGRLGLPADFLIAPNGAVPAAKYGAHADDQWSVDDLLERAATARP